MKAISRLGACLAVAIVLVVGCRSETSDAQAKRYEIRGNVTALGKDQTTVTLDHEDIPGLMQGMEMEFPVDNPRVLEGIRVGDEVHGQLEVRSGGHVISELSND